MNNNKQQAPPESGLSLREIGRRLDIPPSSVAYYKDRFSRFIPGPAGLGRRKRYPARALTIFKEIRQMFNNNWSTEQVEEFLSRKFEGQTESHFHDEQMLNKEPASAALSSEIVVQLTGMLDKISDLLQSQSLLKTEIEHLKQEITQLRQEKLKNENKHQERIAAMDKDLERLRLDRAELVQLVLDRINKGERGRIEPPRELLKLPLVIKSENNEFLGVAGKSGHFSLLEFIKIIEARKDPKRDVEMAWGRKGERWLLTIAASGRDRVRRENLLELETTLTPSGNKVTRLTRLVVDGNTVPDPFLMVLFRKIKEGFDD